MVIETGLAGSRLVELDTTMLISAGRGAALVVGAALDEVAPPDWDGACPDGDCPAEPLALPLVHAVSTISATAGTPAPNAHARRRHVLTICCIDPSVRTGQSVPNTAPRVVRDADEPA
jgi:hypothetical protein